MSEDQKRHSEEEIAAAVKNMASVYAGTALTAALLTGLVKSQVISQEDGRNIVNMAKSMMATFVENTPGPFDLKTPATEYLDSVLSNEVFKTT